MGIREKAVDLANDLANSNEFKLYKELHESVYKDEKNKPMIDDFRNKLMDYQVKVAQTGKENPEELESLQGLQKVLMMNTDIARFLSAEMGFSMLLKDVYDNIENKIKLG